MSHPDLPAEQAYVDHAYDCLEQMRAFARAGCRQFVLSPLMAPDEFLERAERDLLPHVRSIG